MKIMTILGTRPEIIRLSRIIEQLDKYSDHVLVHTGQNYDENLSDIFFRDMGVRHPDHNLGIRAGSFGEQIGKIITSTERLLQEESPDRLLVLGDTNSSISTIVGKRLGIPVFHLEAGNRCYDDRVPEEVNRRIIDHSSDVLLPYTERSRMNLLNEGIDNYRIFVTGNPINEVILHYKDLIERSPILSDLNLEKKEYFLVTFHRAENVDVKDRLESIFEGLKRLRKLYKIPVVISLHPHTLDKMKRYAIATDKMDILIHTPFSFTDFIKLEKNARCVISDSGTVQEECCIFGVPSVTIRDVTERPETIECGSNILSGVEPGMLEKSTDIALHATSPWTPPEEYLRTNVSQTVTKIILGYNYQCSKAR